MKKSTRGGRREGSGRKALSPQHGPRVKVGLTLRPDLYKRFVQVPLAERPALLDRALEFAFRDE